MYREELARLSGVSEADLIRFLECRLLIPDEIDGFRPADIVKARLVQALLDAGLRLDQLRDAVSDGRLSFDYVEHLMPEPTPRVAASEIDDDPALREYEDLVAPILGTSREPGASIREDDLALVKIFARAIELGAPPTRLVRILRSMARSVDHLVELQREYIDEVVLAPAIDRTGSPLLALRETASQRFEYRVLGRRLVEVLMARFTEDAVFKNLVQLTDLALARGGVSGPDAGQTIAFIDVSSYTRLSEQAGDEAAARQATLLAGYVEQRASGHGGRLVKSLGDGAMVHFADPTDAVAFALEAVSGAEAAGLWSLHAGVNTGRMLRRDGDYFGTTVNVAARVSGEAQAGEVLVTRPVVDAWTGGDGVEFMPMGQVALKNVAEPVDLYRAEPAHPSRGLPGG